MAVLNQIKYMTPLQGRVRRVGFSLVELLVVISIIAILSAAGGPVISALTSSGGANQNISQLSGILEQAREYAVSQNTYVWVALYNSTATNGSKQVAVAVIASTDGTDPANVGGTSAWTTYAYQQYGSLPCAGFALVNKTVTLKQLNIDTAGSFSPASLPSLTPAVTSSANSINNNITNVSTGYFLIPLPGTSTTAQFIPAVQFTPSGQARNSSSPVDVIDLDLQPQRGTANDTQNLAVLRLNGLTGEAVVYR